MPFIGPCVTLCSALLNTQVLLGVLIYHYLTLVLVIVIVRLLLFELDLNIYIYASLEIAPNKNIKLVAHK